MWLPLALLLLFPGEAPPSVPIEQRGLQVGEKLPPFALRDQNGRTQTFDTLKGPKGLVLLFVRSADW